MSTKPKNQKKKKTIVLVSGENPIFINVNRENVQLVQRIENPKNVKLIKSEKGTYYVMEIPPEGCLKLSYLTLKKVVGTILKQLREQPKKRVQEVSFDELLSGGTSTTSTEESEEIPFD